MVFPVLSVTPRRREAAINHMLEISSADPRASFEGEASAVRFRTEPGALGTQALSFPSRKAYRDGRHT